MRGLPYAGDRKRGRARNVRARAHIPVHLSGDDGQVRDSESVHVVPQRQEHGLGERGDEQVAGVLELDAGELRTFLINGFGCGRAVYALQETRTIAAEKSRTITSAPVHQLESFTPQLGPQPRPGH